ncbi:hypothetical protein IWW55_000842 [Coemansia sp. RSA 2706]|nr:hypothetical protein IWW55_000842 [Coemansia sp. RSA 2706]KAJ2312936.1 hypothetical protein IWW54_001796 [Coemansia sp. RSA 2705]KAJ2320823.1 hypothetical protein IWW52_001125 [Coemansia sp. RSA 2704]KAJ2329033.1 hypothetical protein IWW51_000849 [Coemansia sp. RSA 2702]KAJ2368304.1 hypothetical protein H4S01_001666 [Coemansia sp. RSA 2610]KAJ2390925.1 hypothetical protein H4S02_001598 [Coemansia sp. RSA 2611]KAJ2738574.1 hypothetical protein H4R23_001055 [Coemansia sp. Cherry 401B]
MKVFNIAAALLLAPLAAAKSGTKVHVPATDPAHPCDYSPCPAGQVCVEKQVQCFAAPCYPIPECLNPDGTTPTPSPN